MTSADESTVTRVVSRDATEIAYWTSGNGPPLVLVHGTPADHTRWRPLLPYLEPHTIVHAMDRRGRGGSGDGPEYTLEREYEDVAAVVDAVAEASGSAVDVYGHSHGGFCAFGAATLTSNIRKLVLYEGWPVPNPAVFAMPAEVEQRMDALLAEGDRDAVVETLFRHFELMSEEDLAAFRAAPSWPGRVAAAHDHPRVPCRGAGHARSPVGSEDHRAGAPSRRRTKLRPRQGTGRGRGRRAARRADSDPRGPRARRRRPPSRGLRRAAHGVPVRPALKGWSPIRRPASPPPRLPSHPASPSRYMRRPVSLAYPLSSSLPITSPTLPEREAMLSDQRYPVKRV